jgi:hypothetical protein
MPQGGKRPGAGKPKGYKHAHTLEREAARKHMEERILSELDPLINAQFDLAKGLMLMFSREKDKDGKRTGKIYRVVDAGEIAELLGSDGENGTDYYYLSVKDPDGKVLENLMSRVFGRAKETVEHKTPPSNELSHLTDEELALLERTLRVARERVSGDSVH